MCQAFRTGAAFLLSVIAFTQLAEAELLYSASLKNGAYGGGFKVGTYSSSLP
jgi:hypothetical protein